MRKKFLISLSGFTILLFCLSTSAIVKGDSEYIGSETCKNCHEAHYDKFVKSIHGKKAIPGTPINREGCESCHGPGAQHVEKGGGKGVAIFPFSRKEGAPERSAKCLACHEEMRSLSNWSMSRHKRADISCDICHPIHMAGVEKNLLKIQEPDLCFECHRNIRAQVNKQSHHPIKEGKIKCSDCHNPMGTSNIKAMIKAD